VRALTFRRWVLVVAGLAAVLAIVGLLAAALGTGLSFGESISALFRPDGGERSAYQIMWLVRLPRVCLAVVVGAALSVAGASFQAIMGNPLAEPYILGLSSGAALGAVLATFMGLDNAVFEVLGVRICFPVFALFALAGCLFSTAVVFGLSFGTAGRQRHSLILTGVIVGAFFSALVLFFTSLVRVERLHAVVYWMMGNLAYPLQPVQLGVVAAAVAAGAGALFAMARPFNALALGDETARATGVDPARFVGLIVPHVVRLTFGSDNRLVLPASFLLGGAFLAAADAAARVLIRNQQLPVGVVTALCGAPVFLALMRARMRGSSFA
jgi:iron complex transport system permease protein